ncbi:hypothetical protein [Streptomyces justiciae]|uniref:Uncharacterized protein n=1 Tax=Streptomyces justiciae TaxID=2780140 RepID=A0ABU3M8Y2_9ACTN|nr:hypothetical protein [Streptomyces justiciae]MDT7847252.1 hypothetical protein [Streptomyces justiciae]
MDQATQATTPTAPTYAGDETFAHAAAVATSVIDSLTTDTYPSSVRIEPILPSGWAVTILFLSHQAAGLYAVAAHADVPVTRAVQGEEIHLEVYARVLEVDVRAAVLVTQAQVAQLEGEPTPLDGEPGHTAAVFTAPVPLGSSVMAGVPAVTPVEVPGGGR